MDHITIGLMSGTSLDGTDAVAMHFSPQGMKRLGHVYLPFSTELRAELAALTLPGENEIERMGDASVKLVKNYAEAVKTLLARTALSPADIAAVGVHGQTIRHRPERGFTLQLNHPALLAELVGIDVVADFRSRDVAAGGEGAPLVPAFHAECFTGRVPRVILNLGGIANISVLPAKSSSAPLTGALGGVVGGDTGPANMLLDTWIEQCCGLPYDKDGALAGSGRVDDALLTDLLDEPYFALDFPKSTGRELFSPAWLFEKTKRHASLTPEDTARTLVELTAVTVTDAVARLAPDARELVLCGGGSFNPTLVNALRVRFPGQVFDTRHLGVDPMEVEAAAFAWLASRFLRREPGNLAAVTHAAGPRVLGALYPAA